MKRQNQPKVFFALGKVGPETFAERGVVAFKPFKIPQEAIDGEDGLRYGELISPFQQHEQLTRPTPIRYGMKILSAPAACDPRPRRAGSRTRSVAC